MKKLTTSIFIEKSKEIHQNNYDYSFSEYINIRSKVIITCKIHGNFEQLADSHLQGKGCPKCGDEKYHKPTRTTEEFIRLANIKHNNFYNYNKTNYIKNNLKVTITCPIHGDFMQTPNTHLHKSGCMLCARMHSIGFSKTKFMGLCAHKNIQPILYIIKCFNYDELFYKIGITSKLVSERFHGKKMPYQYEIVKIIQDNPDVIYDLEKTIHKQHSNFKYMPKIYFPGSCKECFSKFLAPKTGVEPVSLD